MERRSQWRGVVVILVAATASIHAFAPRAPAFVASPSRPYRVGAVVPPSRIPSTAIFLVPHREDTDDVPLWKKAWNRLDTLESAGLKDPNENEGSPLLMRGPGLKRALFWVGVAFLWKWYRARFINKIPVWDRQPQWNMVVTSREQEKELKAYTCKNCGSTLFIAKNREWFFKGDTGLGGLGCYTCGAKGKDNFVMDRDRILEDVGDDDDYFDYERPLDFVSAAERRALMKQAAGDEDVANQMLIDSQKGDEQIENVLDAEIVEDELEKLAEEIGETEVETEKADEDVEWETIEEEVTTAAEADTLDTEVPQVSTHDVKAAEGEILESEERSAVEEEPKKKKKQPKKKETIAAQVPKAAKKTAEELSLDDLDVLGLDDF